MNPPGNPGHLAAAAAARSADTLARARTALADLTRTGQPATVAALARQARVSRSWLYAHPELLANLARPTPVNRPGVSGDSSAWEAWGHAGRFDEAVSAGVAGAGGADGR